MPESRTLHDAFIDELEYAYDAETRLIRALVTMANAAIAPELKTAFTLHLDRTQAHIPRLEAVFARVGAPVQSRRSPRLERIIADADAIVDDDLDGMAMDASLIAAGQRAEHYEIAAYGSLVARARSLGYKDAAGLLELTLTEENAAAETLAALGDDSIDDAAVYFDGTFGRA